MFPSSIQLIMCPRCRVETCGDTAAATLNVCVPCCTTPAAVEQLRRHVLGLGAPNLLVGVPTVALSSSHLRPDSLPPISRTRSIFVCHAAPWTPLGLPYHMMVHVGIVNLIACNSFSSDTTHGAIHVFDPSGCASTQCRTDPSTEVRAGHTMPFCSALVIACCKMSHSDPTGNCGRG